MTEMQKQLNYMNAKFEIWNLMQILSWILFSIAIITFSLYQLNVLEGRTLVSVPVNENPVTFGFPTLFFLLGAFFNIWSFYIQKNVNQNLSKYTFLPAVGFTLGITFLAFLIVVLFALIEG